MVKLQIEDESDIYFHYCVFRAFLFAEKSFAEWTPYRNV